MQSTLFLVQLEFDKVASCLFSSHIRLRRYRFLDHLNVVFYSSDCFPIRSFNEIRTIINESYDG